MLILHNFANVYNKNTLCFIKDISVNWDQLEDPFLIGMSYRYTVRHSLKQIVSETHLLYKQHTTIASW